MLRFVAPAAAIAIVAVIAAASGGLPSSAQTGPIVSVDAVSDASNTATAVGPIQTSRSTTCGATFNVDVVIQGVTNISGFQADLLYNSSALTVTAVNYNYLLTTTGTAVIDFGNPTPDTDGNFLLMAAMFSNGEGANGDGVLARITLQVVGSDDSAELDLTNVKLADAAAMPIPPSDPYGFYTGPVNDASIVVNSPCAVGGIAELPDLAGTALEAGDSSGSSGGLIGAAAAAASSALRQRLRWRARSCWAARPGMSGSAGWGRESCVVVKRPAASALD